MTLLRAALREPLVHFLVIGAAVFALYTVNRDPAPTLRDRIVVSEGQVQQLVVVFQGTWQRPPTPEELRGLVDSHVKEEVYYREALKLGLDRNDTAIRRRMQQKMEFLIEPPAAELEPTEAELEAYLAAKRERFRVEPRIAFRQVYLNVDKPGLPAPQRASLLLDELRRNGKIVTGDDATLLPAAMQAAPLRLIARSFGEDFAAALPDLPVGEWSGPVASTYGLHLVRIESLVEGYDPPLAELRHLVLQEWQYEKRQAYAAEEYRRLREGYDVILPEVLLPAAPAGEAAR